MKTMKKMKTFLALLMLAAMLLPAAGLAEEAALTVQARATVKAEPDSATLSLGVMTAAKDAGSATKDNAEQTAALRKVLTEAGILPEDIETDYFYVSTMYDYSAQNAEGGPVRTGVQVTNSMKVRVREIDRVGEIIDIAMANGADECNSIYYASSKAGEAYDLALSGAVAEARRKGEIMAAAAGGKLGSIVSVTENYGGQVSVNMDSSAKREEGTAGSTGAGDAGTVLSSGGMEMTAEVTVVFRLEPKE